MRNLWLLVLSLIFSTPVLAQKNEESQGNDYTLGVAKGIQLIENKDFKGAKNHLKKLAKSFPNQLDPKYLLLVSEYIQCVPWSKRLPKVIDSYDELTEEFPNESKIYFRRALAKLLLLKYDDAKEDLESCRKISAAVPEVYYYLGYIDLKTNYNRGPNAQLDQARVNFELFLELADSTHVLWKSAMTKRAISQQQNNIYGFTKEEQKLLSDVKYPLSHKKPNFVFSLDTMKQTLCEDLYTEYGVFAPLTLNSDSSKISYSKFISASRLSDLIDIKDVTSFKVVGTKIWFDTDSNTPNASLLEIFNHGNEFSNNTVEFFKNLKTGEYFIFENIETISGKHENCGYQLTIKIPHPIE